MNMKGMPNFGKSLLLSALVVALALMSCQKQENKPLSEQAPTPAAASLNGTASAALEKSRRLRPYQPLPRCLLSHPYRNL